MGRRGRRKIGEAGLVGEARRIARRTVRGGRDEEAARIAQGVYQVALEVKSSLTYPLKLQAPVTFAAELASAALLHHHAETLSPDADREQVQDDIAAYMVTGFFSMVADFNPEHFRRWVAALREAEAGRGDPAEGPVPAR